MFKHLVVVLFADGRNAGGQQHGQGRQQHHKPRQTPVLIKHHHGDHQDLKHALYQHVKHLVDVATHLAHVPGHAVQNVAHRRLIHIAHRQVPELFGNANPEVVGEIAGNHLVHQQYIQIPQQGAGAVGQQQQSQIG